MPLMLAKVSTLEADARCLMPDARRAQMSFSFENRWIVPGIWHPVTGI
jgi:hypothetical protein